MISISANIDLSGVKDYFANVKQALSLAQENITLKFITEARKELINVAPEELQDIYRKCLSIIKTDNGYQLLINGYQLLIDEGKAIVESKSLDAKNTILYFKRDKVKSFEISVLAEYIIKNSPFVLGVIDFIPKGSKVIARKVSRIETSKILAKNTLIVENLKRMIGQYRSLKLIETPMDKIGFDIRFSAMRYELGLLGYKRKPHWIKVRSKLMDSARDIADLVRSRIPFNKERIKNTITSLRLENKVLSEEYKSLYYKKYKGIEGVSYSKWLKQIKSN